LLTFLVAIVELMLSLVLMSSFKLGSADLQFVERLGSIYTLGIDGISALFIPLTALLTVMGTLTAEASVKHDVRGYLVALLGLCASLMGAFAAADVLLFWAFLTLELIPGYILIARFGTGGERRQAARHYAAVMVIASALLLLGLELLIAETGGASDLRSVLAAKVPVDAQITIFVLLCVGLGIKTPVFPLHSWLPRVLEQGPVVGAGVFLVGVKIGTYAFLRIVIPVLPEATSEYYWVLAGAGALGLIYGALMALAQTNLRRLLAFASVSHMGVVLLGLFSMNLYGLQGGLLQMLSIGLAVAGLYFIAGFLHTRVGTPDSGHLGGLAQRTPFLSLAFLVTAMAAVGMPGTSGFNGEHLVVIGAYKVHWVMAVCAGAGTVLTAAYFLRFFQRAFMSEPATSEVAKLPDLDMRERIITVTMVGIVFCVGLYTSPFLKIVDGSLAATAQHIEQRVTAHAGGMPSPALGAIATAKVAQATSATASGKGDH
jgi:NADH-quinone oxidoreductase subunit M